MTHQDLLEPIIEFLGKVSPFEQISKEGRSRIARSIEVSYSRRGSEVQSIGSQPEFAFVVRSGALNELDAQGRLLDRHGEGDCANLEELLGKEASAAALICHEDCLLYLIPALRFRQLSEAFPALTQGLSSPLSQRLKFATQETGSLESPLGATGAKVSSLLHRDLVSVNVTCKISETAALMHKERVSCVLVTGGDELGIVTDRDFRSRVVARGRNPADPIASVMSCPVRCIDVNVPIFEALLTMLDAEVHHLAVVDKGQPVGVVTTTDLVRLETENPVYVLSDLSKQESLEGLVHIVEQRRSRVLERLVSSGARAIDVHRVLTLIGDAVTRRLLWLAERDFPSQSLGEVPAYCWVALGSQARHELNLGSDQDNAMIVGAGVDADDPGARWLAETVCEGLAACGYPKCPGDIMASNSTWRKPLEQWQETFERWIRTPEKRAMMEASIFFDMRAVAGEGALVTSLLKSVSGQAKQQSIFQAHMAHNALSLRPPLGLFRRFVLEKDGEHKDTLDLKHRGLAPVVALARLFALESGYSGANTLDRLRAGSEEGVVSQEGASELESAFEWIALLRLKHQSRCLAKGVSPDSFVSPEELSSTERRSLKDAFHAIGSMQDSIRMSRQLGALG